MFIQQAKIVRETAWFGYMNAKVIIRYYFLKPKTEIGIGRTGSWAIKERDLLLFLIPHKFQNIRNLLG